MEKDIYEIKNDYFISRVALVICLIITVIFFVSDGFGIKNILRNKENYDIWFFLVIVGVLLFELAIVFFANVIEVYYFQNKNQREGFEVQKIMNKCIKCGKEFPAVTYKFVKSVYGVGVPEYKKDLQNGDTETYGKTMCDDCMREKLDDKVQKWNPAQEILISYIKECDLNIFEVEKVHDFISKEITTKRRNE